MIEDTNRCVCCGEIIPEGRQVCSKCENASCLHVWLYEGMKKGKHGQRHRLRWKCQKCGAVRVDKPVNREVLWDE